MTERTIDDAFAALADVEIEAGSALAPIQKVLKALTPHLSATQRGTYWWSYKQAIGAAAPPAGIPSSPDEDYDTPLTWALRTLRGDL